MKRPDARLISSQPRYDHFDISPYEIVQNFVRKVLDALTNRCERNSRKTQDLRENRRKCEFSTFNRDESILISMSARVVPTRLCSLQYISVFNYICITDAFGESPRQTKVLYHTSGANARGTAKIFRPLMHPPFFSHPSVP